ncbi:MAG TPA: serine/threonine-protein kinase [Tepidisphaeraceae bacterium]|jgi:serine/threonine protein kinase|nr:serine/threonine-protein kinase [Tepidisphaeraceae bacterium]
MYQANQRVGEYVLDELVGQNAYAQAWRAHHHMWSDQEAMVKIPTDPQYVSNLRQEGIRVHRLVHPNIIRPIGFDPKAEPPYLITEYVKGESLRAWIAGKRLTIAQSVNVLRHVLEALRYGHDHQVVHGDIKPENILLDASAAESDFASDGSVKVTDFGVGLAAAATVTRDAAAMAQPQGSSLAYVAPEQREGAPPDIKSDIYAVGVVLFEMLTGERPTGAELPSELNPLVPPWLDDVFRKSYARRERRFESAKAFLDALAAQNTASHPAARATEAAPAESAGIRLREDHSSFAATPPEEPAPVAGDSQGNELGLAPEDDYSSPAEAEAESEADGGDDAVATESEGDEPTGVDDDQLNEEQQAAGADTAVLPEDQGGGDPILPFIPRVSSPADRDALFDELNKKQLRSAEDLRSALKGYFEMRDLDAGESANIRLRLMKWAAALAGGKSELDDQVLLINAAAKPLYIVKFLLRSTRGDEPPQSQMLEHSMGDKAASALRAGDYRLIAHFSATALNEKILEAITSQPLRTVVMNLTREARREFFGRIQREDLLIFRANVITTSYRFDQHKYRAFMVGNALSVVSAGEPFTKIRQEPTKRAAALLNGEQIFQGIKELRRALDDSQWESKATVILSALRGKLAAAYMVEARLVYKTFGWLESLEISAKAGQLVPGHEDALTHAALVRKRVGQLQLLPGTIIAVVLIGLALVSSLQSVTPFALKPFINDLVQHPLLFAGIAAWIAALWSKNVLRSRMARTDFAFYQAAVFPLLVALVVAFAPSKFADPTRDAVCGVLLLLVIIADVLAFKKLRRYLFRQQDVSDLVGDGMTVLSRIESMLQEDWDKLRPHYLDLGPLFSFTTVHAAGTAPELFEAEQQQSSDDTVTAPSETRTPRSSSSGDGATGNEEVDHLVSQLNSRISANLRTLAPVARMLLTIFSEYSKSVSNRQIGMMQANAAKLEQKGKDLAAKLADFDRLCRSPLSLGSGENAELLQDASARLAERTEDPDVKVLKSLAERAKDFREDQANATADIQALVGEVEAAIERMKKG